MSVGEVALTVVFGGALVFGLWILGSMIVVGRRRPTRGPDGVWRMPDSRLAAVRTEREGR